MMRNHDWSGSAQRCADRTISGRDLADITGAGVRIPDPERLIHIQFRRFAGCPVCDLHLQSFVRRHDEIAAAGIHEVVVFHSTAEELLEYEGGLPFAVIADPAKRLYVEFGVEASVRALLDPRAWPTIGRAVLRSLMAILRGRGSAPSINPTGGRFGLPADFLVGRDGRVVACNYGRHVGDHWEVDELLDLARGHYAAEQTISRGEHR